MNFVYIVISLEILKIFLCSNTIFRVYPNILETFNWVKIILYDKFLLIVKIIMQVIC